MGAERERVAGFGQPADGLSAATPWYTWGPYVSERAWGTVRAVRFFAHPLALPEAATGKSARP